MGSFFPNTGRRAQTPVFSPLFGMGILAVLVSILMVTPSVGQGHWFRGLGPQNARMFILATMNYLESPLFMDTQADHTSTYWIGGPTFPMGNHPVLPPQVLWLPPQPWIIQLFEGRIIPGSGGVHEYVALAIRTDNRYLLGYFTFRNSLWHAFRGAERFFPNAIALGMDSNYRTLAGGWRGLCKLGVGKIAAERAVTELYWFDMKVKNKRNFKAAVAQMIFMFIEAHRIIPIRDFVALHWNDKKPALIPLHLAEWTVNWKTVSCALKYWRRTGDWSSGKDAKELAKSTTIPIHTVEEALSIIYPIPEAKTCLQD